MPLLHYLIQNIPTNSADEAKTHSLEASASEELPFTLALPNSGEFGYESWRCQILANSATTG